MSAEVGLENDGRVARIVMERPPLNVLTTAMMETMAGLVDRVAADRTARVLRVDARGKVFCAGVDVADHEGDKLAPMLGALKALFDAFERLPVPSIAVVHGAALGGGCELALATDLCLASERASFGQPEIRLGVFAPPASVLLPRLAGERGALGLLLSGEAVSAVEAKTLGIVNRVFPEASFAADADAWIDRIAALSGAALRLAKQAVRAARGLTVAEAHEHVMELYADDLMGTADASEGLRAFLEKRPPVWTDR